MSKKKNLNSDELLEVMTAFMDKLDQKMEKLDDITQTLKEKPEKSPVNDSSKEEMFLKVDIQAGKSNDLLSKVGISPSEEEYIQAEIKHFMQIIMTHPAVEKIEILADKRG